MVAQHASGLRQADQRKSNLDVRRAADILWALNHPSLYTLLTGERGWSPERYERWLGDLLCTQLLTDAARESP